MSVDVADRRTCAANDAFVGEEFTSVPAVDQRDAVGIAVLDAVRRVVHDDTPREPQVAGTMPTGSVS